MFRLVNCFFYYILSVFLHFYIFFLGFVESLFFIPMSFLDKKYAFKALDIGMQRYLRFCKLLGVDFDIRGRENIPKDSFYILASKHQSSAECVVLYSLQKDIGKFNIIMKDSLKFKLPIYGLYLWLCDYVFINRLDGISAAREILKKSKKVIDDGQNILIFPEGTRIQPGSEGEYKEGIYLIYNKLNLPVVPVSINTGLYFPKGKFKRNKGKAIIELLPVINPGLKRKEFITTLKCTIESKTRELEEEGIKQISNN